MNQCQERLSAERRSSVTPTATNRAYCFLSCLILFLSVSSFQAHGRTLRVGIYENNPKVFMDEDGVPQGIFVDIINDIALAENWQLAYVFGTWTEHMASLKNGKLDILPDVSFSQERAESFAFSSPVLESWLDIYAKPDINIRSVGDLHKRKIAVLRGSIQESYLKEYVQPAFDIEFAILPYDDYPGSVDAVKSGAADALVASRFFSFSPPRTDHIVPMHVVFRLEQLHFVFPKGYDQKVICALNRHIARMKNNPGSVYYRSLLHWFEIKPRIIIPAYIKYTLAGATGLLLLAGVFTLLLRQQVAARTTELAKAKRLLQEAESIARMGGWGYDPETRVMKWTDEVFRIAGMPYSYDSSNHLNRIRDFHSQEDASMIESSLEKAVDNAQPFDIETELDRPDGKRIWARIMGRPAIESGKVIRLTGNIMDVTDRKEAEEERQKLKEQLIQAQKLESLGRVAGSVAHDFNNMLSVILGFAGIAIRKIKANQPPLDELKEVSNAAMRSSKITHQLLAFARELSITPKVLNLDKTISEMLSMLRQLAGKRAHISWLPGAEPWNVKMDPAQVDQLITNLCANARDAIKDTGKIIISTSLATFDAESCKTCFGAAPGDFVMLTVSDDGMGMSRDVMDKIYEPFFTTKKNSGGTGLGLATVYGIVKQSGGFINVTSEVRSGTAFSIYIPRHTSL